MREKRSPEVSEKEEMSRPTIADLNARRRRVIAMKVYEARQPNDRDSDLIDQIKTQCAKRGVPYDSTLANQALDSARRTRYLPAEPERRWR